MQPIRFADTDTLSLRQLDELNHAPKGTAFRVFRRCEAQLEEGKDFFYLAADQHKALIEALKTGGIYGAGLDVFWNEPKIDPRFYELDNVVIQPHQGSGTVETRAAMGQLQRYNISAFLAGNDLLTPVN